MKKSWKIIGILFAVVVVIPVTAGAIGGVILNVVSTAYLLALLALPFVLIGVLIGRRKRRKASEPVDRGQDVVAWQTPTPPQVENAFSPPVQRVKVTKSAVVPQVEKPRTVHEPECLDDEEDGDIAYRYKNVGVFVLYTDVFNHPALVEGAIVSLRQEPENTYDHRAVAVVIGRKRIGYLFKGKLQDMANDWLDRGDAVSGRVVRVDPEAYDAKMNAVRINLYFYN